MADLSTLYMGLKLKNPVIAGASNLVNRPENLEKLEKAGAAAIVYKSLFEEQVQLESMQLQTDLHEYNERNAEMIKLFPSIEHAGPKEHLTNLKKARDKVSIPLIASLNAVYKETWIEYASLIEQTGVDALELNFFAVPMDSKQDSQSLENQQIEILKEIKKAVKIPVSVKLSPFYSNPLNIISRMDQAGTNAFVLFNRLFQPDIDLDKQVHCTPFLLSNEDDNRLPLRYAGLLYKEVKADICSNSGIHTGQDVIKMILAGAGCVQVVSTLYKHKIEVITKILADIETWMETNKYSSLNNFRGKLARVNLKDPFVYKRAQYVDLLMKSEEIFQKQIYV
jgi:dihydroorotate dehydrogenase (fumarate)